MTTFALDVLAYLGPLAAAAPGPAPKSPDMWQQIVNVMPMILMMLAVVYFLMIRPQQKRQRERTEMLAALGKGNHIITTGGIRGRITLVRDHEIVVKVDDNVKFTLLKSGVAKIVTEPGATHES